MWCPIFLTRMKSQAHPGFPQIPSIRVIGYANRPENAEERGTAVEKIDNLQ